MNRDKDPSPQMREDIRRQQEAAKKMDTQRVHDRFLNGDRSPESWRRMEDDAQAIATRGLSNVTPKPKRRWFS